MVDGAAVTLDIGRQGASPAPKPASGALVIWEATHGPSTDRRRDRVSRGSSRLHARQPASLDSREDGRRPTPLQGRLCALDAHSRRQRLGSPALAAGMGRYGMEPDPTLDLSRRDAARQCAGAGGVRRQHGRPGDLHLWLQGAEAAIPAAHHRSHRLVVPGLFRARRGIRPCELADKRPLRRRRIG